MPVTLVLVDPMLSSGLAQRIFSIVPTTIMSGPCTCLDKLPITLFHHQPAGTSWGGAELTVLCMLDQQPISELFLSSLFLFILRQDLSSAGWPKPLFVEALVSTDTL